MMAYHRSRSSASARLPIRFSWRLVFITFVSVVLAMPIAYLAAVAASVRLLAEPGVVVEPVDTIVVLGGDGPPRAEKAVELWRAGLAKQAIVAGDGDCTHIRDAMVAGGIPRDAIAIECLSRNTWMNATNSIPLLRASHTESAFLVTSWFHTGRALGVFRLFCPGIRWLPAETEPPRSYLVIATGPYGPAVAKEYFKAIAYAVRAWLFPPVPLAPGNVCVDMEERA